MLKSAGSALALASFAGCAGQQNEDGTTSSENGGEATSVSGEQVEMGDFSVPTENVKAQSEIEDADKRHVDSIDMYSFPQGKAPNMYDASQILAENMAKLGFKVNINTVVINTLFTKAFDRQSPKNGSWWHSAMWQFSPRLTRLDPDELLFNRTPSREGNYNWVHWENEDYTEVVNAQRKATDKKERQKLVYEAQKIIHEQGSPDNTLLFPEFPTPYNANKWEGVSNIKGIGGSNMLTYSNIKPKTDNKTLVEANTSGRGPRNITPFGWGNEVDLRQQRMMYDRLLWPTASGTDFQNRLATNVSYEDDTTLKVDLREGHTWHDGSEVLAEDVKFSYDVNMPESEYSTPLGGSLDPVESVTVDDDYRLTINLEYAWAPVKLALFSRVPIAQKKHWEEIFESDDFKGRQSTLGNYDPQSRVGSGPMIFESWDTASGQVRLKKNPDHFDPIQYEARISKGVSGVQQALSQLRNGQIDIISEYTGDLDVLDNVSSNSDGVEVARTEVCVPYWNTLNCDYPPANIEEFRNASMYCWSPQEIINTLWNGHGRAGHKSMISPVLEYWFNDNLEQYDTDLQAAANELVKGDFVWDEENGDLYMPADHYCLTEEEAQPALDAGLDRDMVMCGD